MAFPLRKQAGQRCLTDRTGQPFLLQGDASWSLLVQLTRDDVELYLADRQRRGFNSLLVNLIEHKFSANVPRNAYGEAPFLVPGNFTSPNEKYFAHVDWVLQRAAERGFVVLLAPSYQGYAGGGEGWYGEMRDSGAKRLQTYGRYLGMRYRNLTNIIWVHGGDFNPPERALTQAIVDGMRETNPQALHSFHGARGTAARAFLGKDASWLDLNTIYTDENSVVAAAATEYRSSPLPFILIEGRYEGEGANEALVRTQAYQAMLSGACGSLMGNKLIWPFSKEWRSALDSPGARSMTRLRALMDQYHWSEMRPAPPLFLVEGAGSGSRTAVAAVSINGRRALVYVPTVRSMVIDTTFVGASHTKAYWVDPASGLTSVVMGSPFNSAKRVSFATPPVNSSGYGDWLLLLESN